MKKETLIKKNFSNLEWRALMLDMNSKELISFNIIREDLMDDLLRLLKEKPDTYTYDDIQSVIKRWAVYHYWCKFEYEFEVWTLLGDNVKKTCVWEQIEPNLDRLTEYIIGELML